MKVWFSQDYRKLAEMVLKGVITMEYAKHVMQSVKPYSLVSELEFYKTIENAKEVKNGSKW